jgi:hypothetical protein
MGDFQVYTDREQCNLFEVPYFREAELTIRADRLLRSKGGDGYDKKHQAYLKSFGTQTITLVRVKGTGPGWWTVTDQEKDLTEGNDLMIYDHDNPRGGQ